MQVCTGLSFIAGNQILVITDFDFYGQLAEIAMRLLQASQHMMVIKILDTALQLQTNQVIPHIQLHHCPITSVNTDLERICVQTATQTVSPFLAT